MMFYFDSSLYGFEANEKIIVMFFQQERLDTFTEQFYCSSRIGFCHSILKLCVPRIRTIRQGFFVEINF